MSQTHLPDRFQLDELLRENIGTAVQLSGIPYNAGTLSPEIDVVPLHYNKPQLRSQMVGANEEFAVWGRGTGKSAGLIAPRTFRNIQAMPRSQGVFVHATYLKLLENTLPPVVQGWENMGWKRNRDFWIREKPPKRLGVPEPVVGPLTTEHCIFFRNGSVASLVSQDRAGSSNGKSVHWIVGDEAKYLNKDRLDNELLMTNRGDDRFFGGIPEFHSLLFCTDMPTTKASSWILEKEKQMDPQRIKVLLSIQLEIYKLYEGLIAYPGKRRSIENKIAQLQKKWDAIRANTLFYSEASTLDNLHGFGAKNLARLKRELPTFIFETAILNKRPFLSENAFYPDLAEHHFYDAYDYAFIDGFDFGKGQFSDSRKDSDVDKYRPLEAGQDYGASINSVVVGQPFGREYRILKEIYVTHPQRNADAARAFCEYYKHHPCKVLRYYFDHTGTQTTPSTDISFADEFADAVRGHGWEVEMLYIGHTPTPRHRFELWGRCLRGFDYQLFKVMFNRNNTEYLRQSMQGTQIKEGGRGFEKDKKNERNLSLDQRTTTHFSDAGDTLIAGAHIYHQAGSREQLDAMFTS